MRRPVNNVYRSNARARATSNTGSYDKQHHHSRTPSWCTCRISIITIFSIFTLIFLLPEQNEPPSDHSQYLRQDPNLTHQVSDEYEVIQDERGHSSSELDAHDPEVLDRKNHDEELDTHPSNDYDEPEKLNNDGASDDGRDDTNKSADDPSNVSEDTEYREEISEDYYYAENEDPSNDYDDPEKLNNNGASDGERDDTNKSVDDPSNISDDEEYREESSKDYDDEGDDAENENPSDDYDNPEKLDNGGASDGERDDTNKLGDDPSNVSEDAENSGESSKDYDDKELDTQPSDDYNDPEKLNDGGASDGERDDTNNLVDDPRNVSEDAENSEESSKDDEDSSDYNQRDDTNELVDNHSNVSEDAEISKEIDSPLANITSIESGGNEDDGMTLDSEPEDIESTDIAMNTLVNTTDAESGEIKKYENASSSNNDANILDDDEQDITNKSGEGRNKSTGDVENVDEVESHAVNENKSNDQEDFDTTLQDKTKKGISDCAGKYDTENKFEVEGQDTEKDCSWVSMKNKDNRCEKAGIKYHCPVTCGICPKVGGEEKDDNESGEHSGDESEADTNIEGNADNEIDDCAGKYDTENKFEVEGQDTEKDCSWVSMNNKDNRCEKAGIKYHCPVTCGICPKVGGEEKGEDAPEEYIRTISRVETDTERETNHFN